MSVTMLPKLIDRRGIVEEMGVTPNTAEAMMRACHKIHVPGLRKVFVKRSELAEVIARGTRRP